MAKTRARLLRATFPGNYSFYVLTTVVTVGEGCSVQVGFNFLIVSEGETCPSYTQKLEHPVIARGPTDITFLHLNPWFVFPEDFHILKHSRHQICFLQFLKNSVVVNKVKRLYCESSGRYLRRTCCDTREDKYP